MILDFIPQLEFLCFHRKLYIILYSSILLSQKDILPMPFFVICRLIIYFFWSAFRIWGGPKLGRQPLTDKHKLLLHWFDVHCTCITSLNSFKEITTCNEHLTIYNRDIAVVTRIRMLKPSRCIENLNRTEMIAFSLLHRIEEHTYWY